MLEWNTGQPATPIVPWSPPPPREESDDGDLVLLVGVLAGVALVLALSSGP